MYFEDSLCVVISRVGRKLLATIRARLGPYGLTVPQFFILIALYEGDAESITALAKKVGLDKATLTGLLDRLERDGFVTRKASPGDRRAIQIHLTEKATRLRDDLKSLFTESNRLFLSVLNREERRVLSRVVDKFEKADFSESLS